MNLSKVILQYKEYQDSEDCIFMVFAEKRNGDFEAESEAKVRQLSIKEMEMNLKDIESLKCPGYEYFLEMSIIRDFLEDINDLEEYTSEEAKVNRVISYAKYNA